MSSGPLSSEGPSVCPGGLRSGPGRGTAAVDPSLSQMYRQSALFPEVPRKVVIEDPSLTEVFRRSASFQKILCHVQGCSESVIATPLSTQKRGAAIAALIAARHGDEERQPAAGGWAPTATAADGEAAVSFAPLVAFLLSDFFPFLNKLVDDIPLENMEQQRFGNRAKREFHRRMEAVIVDWSRRLVDTLPEYSGRDIEEYTYDPGSHRFVVRSASPPVTRRSDEAKRRLAVEMAEYLKDSFGNATRLDYGTGHELHFFLFLVICLEELGDKGGTLIVSPAERERDAFVPSSIDRPAPVPAEGLSRTKALRQQMVLFVFQEYLNFVRRLQKHYSLEPAGSHGVWGLDDYHHIPYILGAAQLIGMERPPQETGDVSAVPAPPHATGSQPTPPTPPPSAGGRTDARGGVVLPKHVCEKSKVKVLCDEYLYFQMIQWILDNKSGPFFEHSNMLYNISAVESWHKTYGGMTKMYAAEVLSKFNVVQHLLFGVHIPWNTQSLDAQPEDVTTSPPPPPPPPQGDGEGEQQQTKRPAPP